MLRGEKMDKKQEGLKRLLDSIYNSLKKDSNNINYCIDTLYYLMKNYQYSQSFIDELNLRDDLVKEMILSLQKKKGICSHHAILYKELLNRHGIRCNLVMVIYKNYGCHMINQVFIDNINFYVDTSQAIRRYHPKNDLIPILKSTFYLTEETLESMDYLIYGKINETLYNSIYRDKETSIEDVPIKSYLLGYDYLLPNIEKKKRYID